MKVLNVNQYLDDVKGSGTAERSFQMSRFLSMRGIDCTILTMDRSISRDRRLDIGNVSILSLASFGQRFRVPFITYKQFKEIFSRPDIIHLMSHWNMLNFLAYIGAKHFKKPYVICPAGALTIFGRSKGIKKAYNRLVGKKIVRNADACIAVTTDEKESFEQYEVKEERIFAIPNGIDHNNLVSKDDVFFRDRYGLDAKKILLFVGRLNRIKGPDLLLNAFCNVKNKLLDWQIVFAGRDEGMLANLCGIAKANDVEDRVHFVGFLGGDLKSYAYHTAELVVIPSRREAMSIVVLEAGVAGKPVLITDQCGFDQIREIKGGIVAPATISGIENALLQIVSHQSDLKKIGKRLQDFVQRHFLWNVIVDKYIKLYSDILNCRL